MLDWVSSSARRNLALGALAALSGAGLLSRSTRAQTTRAVPGNAADRLEDQIKTMQRDLREMSGKIATADKRIAALEAKVGLHSPLGASDQWNQK